MMQVKISEEAVQDLNEAKSIVIWAVVDLRRDPDWIKEKLIS